MNDATAPALEDCYVERMDPDRAYELDLFDCGEPAYNDYLQNRARDAVQAGAAAVYLLISEPADGGQQVLGFWAMSPHVVRRDEASNKWTRGHFDPVPAWLIGQMGLHKDLRGKKAPGQSFTWGQLLMRSALRQVVDAADKGAGALIVIDADNDALIPYYESYDFEPAKRDGKGRPQGLRLVMKMATARASLSAT